jgi:hypothetical protein
MGEPRIDWQGQKLYFHDAAGGVWRVYDCTYVAHRSRAVPLSDPRAVHRAFVRDDGLRRILHFDGGSARAISARVLERQLAAAEHAPAGREDVRGDSPGAEAS